MTLLFVLLLQSPIPAVAQLRTATVDVVTETILGEAIRPDEISLLDVGAKRSVAVRFIHSRAIRVPYGEYTLRVATRGFRIYEQRLRVFQDQVYAHVGLTLAQNVDVPVSRITGRVVRSVSRGERHWARLIPVTNGSPAMDYLISPNGNFEFSGMDPGEYMLLIVRDQRCIYSKQVSTSTAAVEVNLAER